MTKTAIIIVGNGFDLAHNLESSYNEFINQISHKSLWISYFKKEQELKNWIDIEYSFKYILDLIIQLRIEYPVLSINDILPIKYEEILIFLCHGEYNLTNYIAYEKVKTLRATESKIMHNSRKALIHSRFLHNSFWNYDEIFKELLDDFELIKTNLGEYIENINLEHNFVLRESITNELIGYDNIYALNFNYNENILLYENKIKCINVHYSREEKEIVFGHNDIVHKELVKYNKALQRVLLNLTGYQKKLNYEEDHLDFIILGHTMDKNDHEVIHDFLYNMFILPLEEEKLYGYGEGFLDLKKLIIGLKVFKYSDQQVMEVLLNTSELFSGIDNLLSLDKSFNNIHKTSRLKIIKY